MGASNFPGLKFHKGDHASAVIDQVRKIRRLKDEKETQKVWARSGGRCEVSVIDEGRCRRQATQVHHLIGGRMCGRGLSAFSDHKQATCGVCHVQITGTIGGKELIRVGGSVPWWTDRYRRVR